MQLSLPSTGGTGGGWGTAHFRVGREGWGEGTIGLNREVKQAEDSNENVWRKQNMYFDLRLSCT